MAELKQALSRLASGMNLGWSAMHRPHEALGATPQREPRAAS